MLKVVSINRHLGFFHPLWLGLLDGFCLFLFNTVLGTSLVAVGLVLNASWLSGHLPLYLLFLVLYPSFLDFVVLDDGALLSRCGRACGDHGQLTWYHGSAHARAHAGAHARTHAHHGHWRVHHHGHAHHLVHHHELWGGPQFLHTMREVTVSSVVALVFHKVWAELGFVVRVILGRFHGPSSLSLLFNLTKPSVQLPLCFLSGLARLFKLDLRVRKVALLPLAAATLEKIVAHPCFVVHGRQHRIVPFGAIARDLLIAEADYIGHLWIVLVRRLGDLPRRLTITGHRRASMAGQRLLLVATAVLHRHNFVSIVNWQRDRTSRSLHDAFHDFHSNRLFRRRKAVQPFGVDRTLPLIHKQQLLCPLLSRELVQMPFNELRQSVFGRSNRKISWYLFRTAVLSPGLSPALVNRKTPANKLLQKVQVPPVDPHARQTVSTLSRGHRITG
mmetsp:Transcript_137/g.492  ORF Transcript_137/g.492 Transcript_137/m.492 type:complete len:445 (+) Transcript_137:168-1502(+)